MHKHRIQRDAQALRLSRKSRWWYLPSRATLYSTREDHQQLSSWVWSLHCATKEYFRFIKLHFFRILIIIGSLFYSTVFVNSFVSLTMFAWHSGMAIRDAYRLADIDRFRTSTRRNHIELCPRWSMLEVCPILSRVHSDRSRWNLPDQRCGWRGDCEKLLCQVCYTIRVAGSLWLIGSLFHEEMIKMVLFMLINNINSNERVFLNSQHYPSRWHLRSLR